MSLDKLFPSIVPSAPSHLSPARWPGINTESSETLAKTLKENHEKFHGFFNDRGFHNHVAHRLLALWSLGGNGPLIEAAFAKDTGYQRPAFESPEAITETNFVKHLGVENFYNAYLKFFTYALVKNGISDTLEEFVFSKKYNLGSGGEQPYMLSRFLASVAHPLIQTGYGTEFGLLGTMAEGLAQTAVHSATAPKLITPAMFSATSDSSTGDKSVDSTVSRVTALLPSLSLSSQPQTRAGGSGSGAHAFTILARMEKDPLFSPTGLEGNTIEGVLNDDEDMRKILAYAYQWLEGVASLAAMEEKIEEITWMNVLVYAVGGFREGKPFKADFLLMHLVTSTLFLPSLVATLKNTSSRLALLHTYFSFSLATWVGRGRPPLPLASFYAGTTPDIAPPVHGTPSSEGTPPNVWLPLMQSALVHPDEHLPKIQRSLVHYAAVYGARRAGEFAEALKGADERLEGLDGLDGTLFVRAAGLTMDRLGWAREGGKEGDWDRDGFFDLE